ncbi:hypothetical protein G6F57_023350 [Rhizopus arrhizus]|nr:hypothetical protein G6F40_017367 [Rhizopus arrhizus]KAG1425954.1 hypothetical protein G6F57_023350 [Rhizopus arrhizus]
MIWPASSVTSCSASLLANHTTPLAGWFNTPAANPVSSMTALRDIMAPTQRKSMSPTRTGRPPITTPAFAALSAMVSNTLRGRLVSGSIWCDRASMISSAGIT